MSPPAKQSRLAGALHTAQQRLDHAWHGVWRVRTAHRTMAALEGAVSSARGILRWTARGRFAPAATLMWINRYEDACPSFTLPPFCSVQSLNPPHEADARRQPASTHVSGVRLRPATISPAVCSDAMRCS